MKKSILLIMALLLILGSMTLLTACNLPGGDEEGESAINPGGKEEMTIPGGSGNGNGITQNCTVESFVAFSEGIGVFEGTILSKDGEEQFGYGYINSKGQVIALPTYLKAKAFNNGMAAVQNQEGFWGYINTEGKEVVSCSYSHVEEAFDTLAWVTLSDGSAKMINVKGETVYTATGKEVAKGSYQNGYFWIETEEVTMQGNIPTLTYYNEKGKVAFELKNTKHADFQKYGYWNRLESNFNEHGYAVVIQYEGGCKLIDKNGNYQDWIFEGDNTAGTFSITNDYLLYDGHDPAYFIDWKNQKVTWSFNNGSGSYLSNGYYGERSPYVHENGIYKIIWNQSTQTYLALGTDKYSDMANYEEFHYTNIDELQNLNVTGVAYGAQINGKDCFWISIRSNSNVMFTALADIDGNWIIEPTSAYETIYAYRPENAVSSYDSHALYGFSNGLVVAKDTETGLFGYIDLTGNWVIPAQYESATDFYGEGDSAVAVVNGDTLINRKGEVLFSTNGQN